MKIAVLNSSGNVGKSTITKNLIYPRLENALIVEVETYNDSNIGNKNLNIINYDVNADISELYLNMIEIENIIVDVGASNISQFFEKILEFDGLLNLFDYFVIPTVSTLKETKDTIKTINFLQNLDISESKIKVVLNKVKKDVKIEFDTLMKNSPVTIDIDIFIKETKLFSDLNLLRMDISEVYKEDLDFYKNKILSADTSQEKMRYIKIDMCNRMSQNIIRNFDEIFNKLFNKDIRFSFSTAKDEIKKDNKISQKKVEKVEKKEFLEVEINLEESEDF